MIRHYLLPVVLTAAVTSLGLCLSIIAARGVHDDLLSGVVLFAAAVFPFSAIGLLMLMPMVELIKRRSWSTMRKTLAVLGVAGLLGAVLLFWFNSFLGVFCGALGAGIWLGLNWRHLQAETTNVGGYVRTE